MKSGGRLSLFRRPPPFLSGIHIPGRIYFPILLSVPNFSLSQSVISPLSFKRFDGGERAGGRAGGWVLRGHRETMLARASQAGPGRSEKRIGNC